MNSEFLLSALSRFGDHPDRIQEFRKVIVGLAISGRLDGQNEQNSPSELMEAIEAHKAELFARREIAKPKRYSAITDEQLPAQFVDASTFVALGSIARIEKGLTGIQQAKPGPYPLVVTAAERSTCDHFDFEGPAAIIPLVSSTGHGHASINRLHYQEGEFALGTILAAVVPFVPELISARFLFEYLSTFKDELLVTRMTGTANVTLSIGRIAEVPVPLVCPVAQRKVDELMALCDQLEAARAEREMDRDKLTLSTLAKLNEPDPETFADDARFALEHLEPLTKRTDQIKQLRQTIRNLAVRGKLVEQDPNEEPASELIRAIAEDKVARALSARDRRQSSIKPLSGKGCAYVIPRGWVWVAFGDAMISRDGERIPVSRAEREQRKKVYDYYGASGVIDKIDGFLFDKPLLLIGEDGANLINRSTPIAFIARGKYWVNNHAHVLDGISETFLRYIELFINATDLKPYVTGTAQPKMNQAKMNSIPVALPPLSEQHRIVAKVDELMALCDQLEASLIEDEQTRAKLLEAVLHQALEPA